MDILPQNKTGQYKLKVAFIIPDQYWSGSIALTIDTLSGIDLFAQQYAISDRRGFEVSLLHHPGILPKGMSGLAVSSKPLDDKVYDIVIIPAVWTITPKQLKKYVDLPAWLRMQNDHHAHFVSITNGAFFLAEAGVLTGQEVAMHWAFIDLFRALYPNIKVRTDIESCYTGRFWSSSGIKPTMDMIYHLIRHYNGEKLAQVCAKYFMFYEQQNNPTLSVKVSGRDNLIRAIRDWIQQNYHRTLKAQHIADTFNMSYRNLSRRFVIETGMPVYEYLQTVRLDNAAKLLTSTSMTVEQVAIHCGYASQNVLGKSFKKKFGQSPLGYRKFMRHT